MREPIPLSKRKLDWFILFYWAIHIPFITYIVDAESLIIADPYNFEYPLWPPAPLVDLVHWWGESLTPCSWPAPRFGGRRSGSRR